MNIEEFQNILKLADATTSDQFQELPAKTTLSLYVSHDGAGMTVPGVEAVALVHRFVHARTLKGDLYVVPLESIWAANIEGKAQPKTQKRAGFHKDG